MSQFVIHEHHASHLHFDFRVEIEGVLKSWAIPKGPSMNPADKRLAVQVNDHPLEYGDFEGIIPEGHYGAGSVVIWDRGQCEVIEYTDKKISLNLNGSKLRGHFTLTRFKPKGKSIQKDWLLIKKKDSKAQSGWKLELALTEEKKRALEELTPPCELS
jgi:bifunctional non-homologous end joining protein LigD